MSQRVPSWDLDDTPNPSHNLYPSSSSAAAPPRLSMSDYEVAELTWQNGHLSAPALVGRTTPRHAAGGTLESIVNHAKLLHPSYATWHHPGGPHLTSAVDAVVPSTGRLRRRRHRGWDVDLASGIGSCDVSGDRGGGKRARAGETDDSGFASTNSVTPLPDDGNGVSGSPDTENTSFGGGGGSRPLTVADDHASVCHSRRSLSRKRRDRITQKIRTLQKLVPNSSKTDKASMLDEVIEYMQQLQAKVQMMRRMSSIPSMMMPVRMQQFQMTMMARMGMGMGMMGMASLGRTGPASISPVMPVGAFLPMIAAARAWDPSAAAAAERMQQPAAGGVMPDPFSAFVVCQPQQQMTMDAYQRMAALYQQMFQQNQPTNPK